MAEVRLRRWRLQDADDVAVMIDDCQTMIVPSGGLRCVCLSSPQRQFAATPLMTLASLPVN
jgi:hypothetical protein